MKPKDTYEIDKHRLDREWQLQPRLFHEAADKLAEAESEVDRLKGVLELVAAEVELDIRKNPEGYGIKRISNPAVEKAVILDKQYQEALEDYHKAKRAARHLQAEVRYLEHRKSAIEHLSKLRLIDYWADPRISGREMEAAEERLREEAARPRGR